MDNITGWRNLIDDIDSKIVALLNERAIYAIEIGKAKVKKGMSIKNLDRETDVINHVCQMNEGPLSNESFQKIFTCIMEECRNIQKSLL